MIIIHQGAFGAAVAEYLAAQTQVSVALSLDQAMRFEWASLSRDEFIVLALGTLYPERLSRLTDVFWDLGLSHCVAVLSDHLLTTGPLVVPGEGPCYACSMKRLLSMVESPRHSNMDLNLQHYLERRPALELRGHVPTLVQMAALKLLRLARRDIAQSGRLSVVSLVNHLNIETRVIALHRCRCRGEQAPCAGDRSLRALEQDVEDVLGV
jgi:hypothetical protein